MITEISFSGAKVHKYLILNQYPVLIINISEKYKGHESIVNSQGSRAKGQGPKVKGQRSRVKGQEIRSINFDQKITLFL